MSSAKRPVKTVIAVTAIFMCLNVFLPIHLSTITKEEAIEISRNTELVQRLLAEADRYTLEVHYLNETQVNKLRERPWAREFLPENCAVWDVTWYIHPQDAPSAFAYVVGHYIDAQTGKILHEGWSSAR